MFLFVIQSRQKSVRTQILLLLKYKVLVVKVKIYDWMLNGVNIVLQVSTKVLFLILHSTQ